MCCGAAGFAQPGPAGPRTIPAGPVKLTPGGFFELLGMERSATTPDPIHTRFGAIPLEDTPAEALLSPSHSRLQLRADTAAIPVHLTGYLEADFLSATRGGAPFRWRQMWGAARWGRWELLAGKAWSLLRPNRAGIDSDVGLMNTLVIEPAYHVGLVGSRTRQVRLSRTMGEYHAVLAWESSGNFIAKVTADKRFGHVELAGMTGHRGQRGISAAAMVPVRGPVRFVTQHYWSKRAASLALGVVPAGVSGGAALEGIELAPNPHVDIYAYAGWVWAARSGGNHVVDEYTVGANYRVPVRSLHGVTQLGFQLSRIDRELWTGRPGAMTCLLSQLRYSFN